MPALTVWPSSTAREMTMPSMGAVMTVWARFTSAELSCDFAWTSAASADLICACADCTLTCAVSRSVLRQEALLEERLRPVEFLLRVGERNFQPIQIRLGAG